LQKRITSENQQDISREPQSTVRIQFEHCDPFGHLNNMQYLSYIMNARTNHLRDYYNFDLFEHGDTTGNNWVVSRTRINYLLPIKLNQEVNIQTRLLYADERHIVPEAVIKSPINGRLHAVAWIEFVYINVNRARPVRHSPALMQFFKSIEFPLSEFHLEKFEQRVRDLGKNSTQTLTR